jgi:hypothetical protein
MQLRYLQTLVEIAAENNSTTVFPIPMDLLTPFMDLAKRAAGAVGAAGTAGATGTALPPATGVPIPDPARARERA